MFIKHGDILRKWFAQYLVMKRIPLEENHHALYNNLLLVMNDAQLLQYVRSETLRNVKVRHLKVNFFSCFFFRFC